MKNNCGEGEQVIIQRYILLHYLYIFHAHYLLMNTNGKAGVIAGIVIVVLLVVAVGYFLFNSNNLNSQNENPTNETPSASSQNTVEIKDFKFVSNKITIKQGETITWINKDSMVHTVTSDSGSELDSLSLSQGQTYSYTFNSVGTFDYHCTFHSSMKAKIIVE